jgi:putative ABC transport system permease protein
MKIYFKIILEGFRQTVQQLLNNKLRTFLSLFGITIGILSIISILTSVDALKNNIESSIKGMGENVLFVQKWPWAFGDKDYPWWKYFERPHASYKDFEFLERRVSGAQNIAFEVSPNDVEIKYGNSTAEAVKTKGVTSSFGRIFGFNIEKGRYFSESEARGAMPVAIMGDVLREELFGVETEVVGKEVEIFNRKVQIIGVLKRKGEDLLGFNFDATFILPYSFVNQVIYINPEGTNPSIIVQAKPDASLDELRGELISIMRSARSLRPRQDDNFAINQLSILQVGFEGILKVLKLAAWIIGSFALLVGGFGIANIMYVTVSERTPIIGIKKALGAKKIHILIEFLIESVGLCILGGFFGLLIVYFLTDIMTSAAGFEFVLTMKNVVIGVGISVLIGVVSGIFPAIKASRLDPVEAIRG